MEELEQLARIDGALVFRIPTLVAEAAPEGLAMTLTVEGEAVRQSVALDGYRSAYGDSLEGPGYDSPEEAVTAYLEAMKKGDARGMLSTFAIETYVAEMDAQAYLERLRSFSPTNVSLPLGGDYQRQVAVAVRYGELANSLAYQWILYSWPDGMRSLVALWSVCSKTALWRRSSRGWRKTTPPRGAGDGGRGVREPVELSDMYLDERNQQNIARQAAIYGCDEMVTVAVKLDIGGEEWYQCMDVARYGGSGTISRSSATSVICWGFRSIPAALSRPRRFERPTLDRVLQSGVPPVRGALFCLFRCLLPTFLL